MSELMVTQATQGVPGGVFAQWTAGAVLLKPLAWLYLEGPRAWGFWGGATFPDICAQLTNTRAQFWEQSADASAECVSIVQRHYWSYVVLVSSVSYAASLVWLMRRCCDYAFQTQKKRRVQ